MKYKNGNHDKQYQTADPSKYPQGYFKEKKCKCCETEFKPKAPSELYCKDDCKDRAYTSAYLLRQYKIDLDTYEKMLKEQNDRCKICLGEGFVMDIDKHRVKLVVDHCHNTGKVRGLLCHNCNRALGLLKDDKDVLLRAFNYVH